MTTALIILVALVAGMLVSVCALGASVVTKLSMVNRGMWPDGRGSRTAVTLDLIMLIGGPAVAVATWLILNSAVG